eukprot:scaffold132875_cov29-Attheya_sp.AAC.1
MTRIQGSMQKPNLSHVELDTQLWFVNCVDNLGGNKESLRKKGKLASPSFNFGFVVWRQPQFKVSRGMPLALESRLLYLLESIAIDDPSQMKTCVYQGGSELLTGLNPYIGCQPCRTRRH